MKKKSSPNYTPPKTEPFKDLFGDDNINNNNRDKE